MEKEAYEPPCAVLLAPGLTLSDNISTQGRCVSGKNGSGEVQSRRGHAIMAVTEVAETAGADSKGSFCAVTFWAYSPDRKCECVSTRYLSPWAEGSPGAIPSLSDLQGPGGGTCSRSEVPSLGPCSLPTGGIPKTGSLPFYVSPEPSL